MRTCNKSLARINNTFSYKNNVHFEADKIPFQMVLKCDVNRILHASSFCITSMKLAEGSFLILTEGLFHKFQMK